jgi:hypothetical protein
MPPDAFSIINNTRTAQRQRTSFRVLPGLDGQGKTTFVEPADVVKAWQHLTVAEQETRLAQQRMLLAQGDYA